MALQENSKRITARMQRKLTVSLPKSPTLQKLARMFIPIPFESVNSAFQPAAGTYAASCSKYAASAALPELFVFEYALAGSASPTVYDLLIVEPSGAVRVRDYVWMADRSWRDSAGAKSDDLTALFPAGLFDLRLVRRDRLPSITIGDRHVQSF